MEVSPAILEFKGPFTKTSTEKLHLTNTSNETLAFKVKTTAPKLYCVRPNASIIQPGDSLEVAIISQGLKEEPPADFKCKDKFLLVTLPCPYDGAETKVAELWPQLEQEFKSTSKKIKVNYLLTGSASASHTGNVDQVVVPPIAATVDDDSTVAESNTNGNVLSDDKDISSEQENPLTSTISEKVAPVKQQVQQQLPASKGGIPLPLALVIAILAFLIGLFCFK